MSHSFLEFADFDGAWRYSSTASIGTAQTKHIAFAGSPTLVHIRAPISGSMPLSRPAKGSIASRRRAQSDGAQYLTPNTGAGAERPISAILVSFAPVKWSSSSESEPHPGHPADVSRGEENEAVSPKSRLPGALQRVILRRETTGASSLRFVEGPKRIGTSMKALKSPYPTPASIPSGARTRARLWVKKLVGKLGR